MPNQGGHSGETRGRAGDRGVAKSIFKFQREPKLAFDDIVVPSSLRSSLSHELDKM